MFFSDVCSEDSCDFGVLMTRGELMIQGELMIRGELSVFLPRHLGQSAGTEVTHLSIIKATYDKSIA